MDSLPRTDWPHTGLRRMGYTLHTDWHHRVPPPHKDYILRHRDWPRTDCKMHMESPHTGTQHMDWPHRGSPHTGCCPLPEAVPGPNWPQPEYLPYGCSGQARPHRSPPETPRQIKVCFSRSFPETIHSKHRTYRNTDPTARKGQDKPQPAMHTARCDAAKEGTNIAAKGQSRAIAHQ